MTIEGADEVRLATDAYASLRGDFADYLIAERSIANGCPQSPPSTSSCILINALRHPTRYAQLALPTPP
jgi:hypothetical protein